ncbi:hypothetical protein [Porphyrobacter sp. LM 6]|uniref:hypothetical protein n=1 Tax=Porphyrobacter sp. LM 6 TaxID=1896196 RepID=UPI00168186A0|nr:hypothetical protein [Porphyrobacter sp. LM 6]
MFRFILAAMCLALAPHAWAGQKAEKIAVTPDGERALVIIKAKELEPPLNMASGFHLTFAPYDAQQEAIGGSILGGGFTLLAKPKLFYDGYLVADVPPGTYAFQQFTRQDRWALCYNNNSRVFTIKAGEALYLGEFDSRGSLMDLENEVTKSLRFTSVGGSLVHFFDVAAPRIKPVGEGEIAKVQSFVTSRMPRTTSIVQSAVFSEGRFGTGKDLFGTNRVCGGYYKGSAKPK